MRQVGTHLHAREYCDIAKIEVHPLQGVVIPHTVGIDRKDRVRKPISMTAGLDTHVQKY